MLKIRLYFSALILRVARKLDMLRAYAAIESCRHVGMRVKVYGLIRVYGSQNVTLGDDCSLNHGVLINARAPVTIGNNVTLSSYVQIYTAALDVSKNHWIRRSETLAETGDDHVSRAVKIEDGVWLAAGVIVCGGVVLNEGCVIAAGSVVTRSVPSGELWGGVPARFIKKLVDYSV